MYMEVGEISKGNTYPSASLAPRLRAFKEIYCDENRLIAGLLCSDFRQHFYATVLDVGAGLGDIALSCFPDLPAVLLDTEAWDVPTSPNHTREVFNFFDYADQSRGNIGTILLSHVLQYLDNDERQLRSAIRKISPRSVITVLNDNSGTFGELIKWTESNIPGSNPEMPLVPVDPRYYRKVASRKISARMTCPSFSVMAEYFVSVLVDADASEDTVRLMEFQLRSLLPTPEIEIDETISCYERTQ